MVSKSFKTAINSSVVISKAGNFNSLSISQYTNNNPRNLLRGISVYEEINSEASLGELDPIDMNNTKTMRA